MSRYVRQTILPEVGLERQGRLGNARIVVVGAGGLAAPLLPYLAGAGVGHMLIVDPDVVDVTNLHRQTLFREQDVGKSKAQLAAKTCSELNSEIVVEPREQALTPANVDQIVDTADMVLDCADSYAVSYTLSDVCLRRQIPFVSASVLGFAGYVGGFCAGAPSLRAVFPAAPQNGASCATAGVVGSVVGVLGSLQAQMALHILLGLETSPLGLLVNIDLRNFVMRSFRFDNATEPLAPLHFAAISQIEPDDFVVELRPESEAPLPVTPGSLRILPDDLIASRIAPRPHQRAVLCCASGLRAWRTAERLRSYWPGEIVLVAATSQMERKK